MGKGGYFVCIQCGPGVGLCGIKVIGPTLGFVAAVLTAIVAWPTATVCRLVSCCDGGGGDVETGAGGGAPQGSWRASASTWWWKPFAVNTSVSGAVPI
ncbi:hypothetical protein I4F81_011510 [Pyropia yezoensis]|uniref:Uncharacterized protein n=1 Tax=Pyropia yezoensis TaxID=2788 RepID=A0ACC3CGS8_PYRYE|nr:hypothetical protein I4F81_011510 [Neopyropia yezoensis]